MVLQTAPAPPRLPSSSRELRRSPACSLSFFFVDLDDTRSGYQEEVQIRAADLKSYALLSEASEVNVSTVTHDDDGEVYDAYQDDDDAYYEDEGEAEAVCYGGAVIEDID